MGPACGTFKNSPVRHGVATGQCFPRVAWNWNEITLLKYIDTPVFKVSCLEKSWSPYLYVLSFLSWFALIFILIFFQSLFPPCLFQYAKEISCSLFFWSCWFSNSWNIQWTNEKTNNVRHKTSFRRMSCLRMLAKLERFFGVCIILGPMETSHWNTEARTSNGQNVNGRSFKG